MREIDTYLWNLGLDLKGARKRRQWTLTLVHQRLQCSVQTVQRMEKGDPAVGMGRYLAYIHLLGLSLNELDDSAQIRLEVLGKTHKD
ncbi:helix-turn-helix domain-containing protein [Marinimicrobium sp. ABcell2]|uniref:helix-turn-helix domain-containing protein n=1 Tax=Marinimicrobium sp. ABcell2 TaxID=3069751 RepID=UPI0027AF3E25|nr:helix-turn-helix domain-containing protein [Marinimicrobium sp. ABcell2]MDQ2076668.1 helix-turn-helix domain-containing protein [Marinimicrobium sp. ABcell2]